MKAQLTTSILFIFALFLLGHQPLSAQDQVMSFTHTADDDKLEWGSCPAFMTESCRIAVLHGNPANPNADVFFKMQGNTTVPAHWHNSAERMVLVSGEMEVKYEGQEAEIITTGSYAYGPPEKPHRASCLSDEPCVLFIAFNKPVDAYPVEGTL
ncbi:cupin [Rhodohalobacter mucosus]|uniref:Cupin n=2 Tax=Rhodohalobacter mucosus TaxID=2079485 RepID=A0A316TUX2_9BACT|nr:cupin [Rhodohalobacter mucosus]